MMDELKYPINFSIASFLVVVQLSGRYLEHLYLVCVPVSILPPQHLVINSHSIINLSPLMPFILFILSADFHPQLPRRMSILILPAYLDERDSTQQQVKDELIKIRVSGCAISVAPT